MDKLFRRFWPDCAPQNDTKSRFVKTCRFDLSFSAAITCARHIVWRCATPVARSLIRGWTCLVYVCSIQWRPNGKLTPFFCCSFKGDHECRTYVVRPDRPSGPCDWG